MASCSTADKATAYVPLRRMAGCTRSNRMAEQTAARCQNRIVWRGEAEYPTELPLFTI